MKYRHVAPALYSPHECTPANTPDGHLPAEVHYLDHNRVRVTHPSGDWHRNAVATRERLARRGYRVMYPPLHTTTNPET